MSRDLLVLVPDRSIEAVMEVLLTEKHEHQLRIRSVSFEILRHHRKDPGIRSEAPEILKIYHREFSRVLIILDHRGSGFEGEPEELEERIKESVIRGGLWREDGVEVVVIAPELEAWVWGAVDVFPKVFGGKHAGVKDKPGDPKGEFERFIRDVVKRPYSSSIFREIAGRVSRRHIDRCRDRSFRRLVDTLRRWFPGGSSS